MSKTLWYINHYAGEPGVNGAYRAFELTRAWRDTGNHARVVLGIKDLSSHFSGMAR